jgi:hypothetical protein
VNATQRRFATFTTCRPARKADQCTRRATRDWAAKRRRRGGKGVRRRAKGRGQVNVLQAPAMDRLLPRPTNDMPCTVLEKCCQTPRSTAGSPRTNIGFWLNWPVALFVAVLPRLPFRPPGPSLRENPGVRRYSPSPGRPLTLPTMGGHAGYPSSSTHPDNRPMDAHCSIPQGGRLQLPLAAAAGGPSTGPLVVRPGAWNREWGSRPEGPGEAAR